MPLREGFETDSLTTLVPRVLSGEPLFASRQVRFQQLLVAARKTVLGDALSDALGMINPDALSQVSEYVPADVQKILAVARIRDEYVFPMPMVLESKPTLLGFYRLLLGVFQKSMVSVIFEL